MLLFILVYNLVVVALLALVAAAGPRTLARGLHPDLKALLPAPTPRERRREVLWKVPLLVVMLGLPQGYLLWAGATSGADFWALWFDGFLILMSFNLVDLVVVDWLLVCWWTPRFLIFPGTEGHPAYKDYAFHARASLRGTVLLAVVSAAMAGVASAW